MTNNWEHFIGEKIKKILILDCFSRYGFYILLSFISDLQTEQIDN